MRRRVSALDAAVEGALLAVSTRVLACAVGSSLALPAFPLSSDDSSFPDLVFGTQPMDQVAAMRSAFVLPDCMSTLANALSKIGITHCQAP
jgi:hypothetical protein